MFSGAGVLGISYNASTRVVTVTGSTPIDVTIFRTFLFASNPITNAFDIGAVVGSGNVEFTARTLTVSSDGVAGTDAGGTPIMKISSDDIYQILDINKRFPSGISYRLNGSASSGSKSGDARFGVIYS